MSQAAFRAPSIAASRSGERSCLKVRPGPPWARNTSRRTTPPAPPVGSLCPSNRAGPSPGQRARSRGSSSASPTSSVHFITWPGGLTTDPTVREVVGRQSADGWEIYARSGTAPGLQEQRWTDWRRVQLTPRGKKRLTAILEDQCLWSAPRFLDGEVRLLNGRGDARPDGPSTGYDVTRGNRRWGGWHFSWSVGPPGQLRSLLLSETFGLPEWVENDIGPDGWFDWPSKPR